MNDRIAELLKELRPLLDDLELTADIAICGRSTCERCTNARRALDVIAEAVNLNHLQGN